jgi:hypothetical protein
LRYNHLQEAAKATGGDQGQLIASLTELWKQLLQHPERMSVDFWHLHTLARLIAMGDKFRPISIMNTLTRAFDGALVRGVSPQVTQRLVNAGQMGAGVENGLERLITATVTQFEGGQFIYVADGGNAFNSIERGPMLEAVRGNIPAAFDYLAYCYGHTEPTLIFRLDNGEVQRIISRRGTPQGSPLGALLYCLTTLEPMEKFQRQFGEEGYEARAYIDDTNVSGGPPEAPQTAAALASLEASLASVGVALNRSKSQVTCQRTADFTGRRQQLVNNELGFTAELDGVVICGVPVGTRDYQLAFIDKKLEDLKFHKTAEKLGEMAGDDTQNAMLVLRLSMAARTNYLKRNVTPGVLAEVEKRHDNTLLWVTEKMTALSQTVAFEEFRRNPNQNKLILNTLQQEQALLPVREGGFGLQSMRDTAPGAFVAAQVATLPYAVRRLSASRNRRQQEILEQLPHTPRIAELHRALKHLQQVVGNDALDCLPALWREWAAEPPGTAPTIQTLEARDIPTEGERRGEQDHVQRKLNRAVSDVLGKALLDSARRPQEHRGAVAGLESETPREATARLLSLRGEGPGDYLGAKATETATTMEPEQFQLAIRARLGISETLGGNQCVANSCQATRAGARHTTHCMRTGGPQRAHKEVLNGLVNILQKARIPHAVEDTSPFPRRRENISGRHQAMDVTVPAGALQHAQDRSMRAKHQMFDITIAYEQAPTHLNNPLSSANFAGAAGDRATHAKTQQYRGSFSPATHTLRPMAFESSGRMCGSTLAVLEAVAEHVVGGSMSPRFHQKGALLRYYRQIMSVALQRGRANTIISARRRLAVHQAEEWEMAGMETSF